MTIQHAVLLGFDPELDEADREELVDQVRAWPKAIGGFRTLRVGPPLFTARSQGYHFLLFMELADEEALEAYQVHPVHQRFASWVVDHGGTVLAFDYALDETTVIVPGPGGPA